MSVSAALPSVPGGLCSGCPGRVVACPTPGAACHAQEPLTSAPANTFEGVCDGMGKERVKGRGEKAEGEGGGERGEGEEGKCVRKDEIGG